MPVNDINNDSCNKYSLTTAIIVDEAHAFRFPKFEKRKQLLEKVLLKKAHQQRDAAGFMFFHSFIHVYLLVEETHHEIR